jgi:RNA polymerase sigma-70 factor, ECF subfamily
VRLYSDRLFRFLAARGLDQEDARDLVQETFIRAYAAIERFDPRFAISTWLYVIAERLALNLREAKARRPHVALDEHLTDAAASPAHQDDHADGAAGPQGSLWAIAREELPERHFTALWLYYAEEQDMKQIAKVLGITALHARVIVHRARGRLAKLVTTGGARATGSFLAGRPS